MSVLQRFLSRLVEIRDEERVTAVLMFVYSSVAMTSYNIVQPLMRATFISALGADNIPYVLFAAGLLIGVVMHFYGRLTTILPRWWIIPVSQLASAGLLILFWTLFRREHSWASAPLYFFGLVLGTLLLSQFWTLANDIYDARQARRLFGFIGGGAHLGGMAGAGLTMVVADRTDSEHLLLWSAAFLLASMAAVLAIIRRERLLVPFHPIPSQGAAVGTAPGQPERAPVEGPSRLSGVEAIRLLTASPHLRLIALLIAVAATAAVIVDQQLSMAAEAFKGQQDTDAITSFLASVRFWLSAIGFVAQVWLVKHIYRRLGVAVALMLLPIGLGLTGVLILLQAALWAPAAASVVDRSLRYSVDRTTREILFLPLPSDVAYRAKPFVDVTLERTARGAAAVIVLWSIKPWGLALAWPMLSILTLVLTALWLSLARGANRRYVAAVRSGLEMHRMQPGAVRTDVADLTTLETLFEELAHPDEQRVLYAIDLLESFDKQNLITPLLLHHESPAVRARALMVVGATRSAVAQRSLPLIERLLLDDSAAVRTAAVTALANRRNERAVDLARRLLDDRSPRIAATAAAVLTTSEQEDDIAAGETVLDRLTAEPHVSTVRLRRDVAAAIGRIRSARASHVLIRLLSDPDAAVAEEALRSLRELRTRDALFLPTLIALLGHRRLKSDAREALVQYGEAAVDPLGHVVRDPGENPWVRRHIPATLARIPCQRSADILIDTLSDPDSFLRYKAVSALEKLRRDRPGLAIRRAPIETLVLKEARGYFSHLTRHHNLFVRAPLDRGTLIERVLDEKMRRGVDRIYRLLTLLHPWKDVAAARWAIERGDAKTRSTAFEFLDNILVGELRLRLMPILEDLPLDEKVRRGNVWLRTRPREVDDTLLDLIHEDDQVVAATALLLVRDAGVWSLTDDIRYLMNHRDEGDRWAIEAASWVLATRETPPTDSPRDRLETVPTVLLVDRLRGLPMFASVGIDELFRIVSSSRRVRRDAGTRLSYEAVVPDTLHVLLDGQAVATAGRSEPRPIRPPATLGFEEVLEQRAMNVSLRTVEPSVTLTLSIAELHTLLADNTDLIQGLFRTLVARDAGRRARVVRGTRGNEPYLLPPDPLSPVQKGLALQRVPAFSQIGSEEILQLASVAHEVAFQSGDILASETDPPLVWVVLAGELVLQRAPQDSPEPTPTRVKEQAGGPARLDKRGPATTEPIPRTDDGSEGLTGDAGECARAGPGDAVGIFETLAGRAGDDLDHIPLRLRAPRSGRALRIEGEELFDLLGERPRILQQLLSGLFGAS